MTQPGEPDLPELIEAARAAAASAVTGLSEAMAEVETEARALRAEWARDDEARAEKARAGELGPAMRTLQQRVDLGQTTWGGVLSGSDASAEAQGLRTDAAHNSGAFAAEVDAALSADTVGGRTDPREELIESLAALRERSLAAIAEHGSRGERGQ